VTNPRASSSAAKWTNIPWVSPRLALIRPSSLARSSIRPDRGDGRDHPHRRTLIYGRYSNFSRRTLERGGYLRLPPLPTSARRTTGYSMSLLTTCEGGTAHDLPEAHAFSAVFHFVAPRLPRWAGGWATGGGPVPITAAPGRPALPRLPCDASHEPTNSAGRSRRRILPRRNPRSAPTAVAACVPPLAQPKSLEAPPRFSCRDPSRSRGRGGLALARRAAYRSADLPLSSSWERDSRRSASRSGPPGFPYEVIRQRLTSLRTCTCPSRRVALPTHSRRSWESTSADFGHYTAHSHRRPQYRPGPGSFAVIDEPPRSTTRTTSLGSPRPRPHWADAGLNADSGTNATRRLEELLPGAVQRVSARRCGCR